MTSKIVRGSLSIMLLLVAFMLVGMLLVSAQDDMPEDEGTVFDITMRDYQFLVEGQEVGDPITLQVGKVYTFNFTHEGTVEHEVLIGQMANEIAENIHHDFNSALLEDVEVEIFGVMNEEDFVIGVSGLEEFEMHPGQELSITFTLSEEQLGDWEMGCFVFLDEDATIEEPSQTHYDAGMHLTISVVAGE